MKKYLSVLALLCLLSSANVADAYSPKVNSVYLAQQYIATADSYVTAGRYQEAIILYEQAQRVLPDSEYRLSDLITVKINMVDARITDESNRYYSPAVVYDTYYRRDMYRDTLGFTLGLMDILNRNHRGHCVYHHRRY